MILIVASTVDSASSNIAKKLINHYKFKKTGKSFDQNPIYSEYIHETEVLLVFINHETIWSQHITDYFSPHLVVFVSRHSSLAGIPTLSVHTPGNLGTDTKWGGIPRKVSISPAGPMKSALIEMARLKKEMTLNYDVSYECTHHGPSLDVPTMFVELGSSSTQWNDSKAAQVVAHATMAAVSKQAEYSVVLGVGGPHYNKKFTKIALETPLAFGHIIPKHIIPILDAEIIGKCINRTNEQVRSAIFDWKGMRGGDRDRLISTFEKRNIPVERV